MKAILIILTLGFVIDLITLFAVYAKGGYYKHFKGGLYRKICESVDEDDPDYVRVIYKSTKDGKIYSRGYNSFYDGDRFEKLSFFRFLVLFSKEFSNFKALFVEK